MGRQRLTHRLESRSSDELYRKGVRLDPLVEKQVVQNLERLLARPVDVCGIVLDCLVPLWRGRSRGLHLVNGLLDELDADENDHERRPHLVREVLDQLRLEAQVVVLTNDLAAEDPGGDEILKYKEDYSNNHHGQDIVDEENSSRDVEPRLDCEKCNGKHQKLKTYSDHT